MNGVDAALAKYSWIDADRLGVTGGSLRRLPHENWIVSHTNRFKAAVHAPQHLEFRERRWDEGWGVWACGRLHRRHLQKTRSLLERVTLKYAQNVKTPTLVLHSDNDFPRADRAGRAVVPRLQHFGVPSEIVFFPRENHN